MKKIIFLVLFACLVKAQNTYVIQKGDTWYGIAKRNNTSVEKLQSINQNTSTLKTGEQIVLFSNNINITNTELKSATFHIVQPKETWYGIAKKHRLSVEQLQHYNPQITSTLEIGQQLRLSNIENQEITNTEVTSNAVDKIVTLARSFIGSPYKSGGTTENGFDCSGLVYSCHQSEDITLPRTSREMSTVGVSVSREQAQKGDLIFFTTNGKTVINHVGIISEVNEEGIKFIHSSSSNGVIETKLSEDYYSKTFKEIRRINH
jgi:peptidoglycan DL-endopeptidase LytE